MTKMISQLRLQRRLQHLAGQQGQQAIRAGQLHALLARLNHQLLRHRRHIRRRRNHSTR